MSTKNHRDINTVFIGGILVFSVGAYFIGRTFFSSPQTAEDMGDISAQNEDAGKNAPVIALDVLQKKINNNDPLKLIDVRSSEEYKTEHIPHSISIPIGGLDNFSPEKDEQVVIIFSERDAATFDAAKNILNQKSYTHFFLQGGFEKWKVNNYQTVSFGNPNSFVDQAKITYISPDAFKALLSHPDANIFILDTQSAQHFEKNHIKGAVNIPLDQIEKRVVEIPPAKLIIVYGENELISFQSGVRLSDLSILAVKTLSGNENVSATSVLPLVK